MEDKITNVKQSIEKIKDNLRNNNIRENDLDILMKLKDLPDDLHEVIVLIYSYGKHNVHLLQNKNNDMTNDMTDVMNKLLDMAIMLNGDVTKSKKKLFTVNNLPYIVGTVAGMFLIIWIGYVIDPEATKYVTGLIGDTFSSMKKYIITTVLKL